MKATEIKTDRVALVVQYLNALPVKALTVKEISDIIFLVEDAQLQDFAQALATRAQIPLQEATLIIQQTAQLNAELFIESIMIAKTIKQKQSFWSYLTNFAVISNIISIVVKFIAISPALANLVNPKKDEKR